MKQKTINWDKYSFRCHRLGDLAIKPKKKGDLVAETTKAYLYQIYDQEVYGIREEVRTKEIRKGLEKEAECIDLINRVHGTFFSKNHERRDNGWINGECDIVDGRVVVDNKASWNKSTFNRASLTKGNYWQMVGYLWLWCRRRGYVVYVLTDTPEEFVADELRKLSWQMGMIDDTDPEYIKAAEQVERNMRFSDIDPQKRVKCFPVELFEDKIDFIKERVQAAREFLKQIEKEESDYGRIVMSGEKTTTPLAEEEIPKTINIIDTMAQIVADVHDLDSEMIKKKRGADMYAKAKIQFRVLLLRRYSTYQSLGEALGMTHVAIFHSVKNHHNYIKNDKRYRTTYEKAERIYSEGAY